MDRRVTPQSQSTHRLPLGFVGMVSLLILGETCLAIRAPDFLGEIAYAWRWGARSAQRDAPKSEVLCFGDSLVKFGVAPRVVESRTGRTMWNLAVTGGRPANSYFLLRRALDAGARPAALVLDADLLYADPFEIPYLWPQLATPGEIIEMAWMGGNPDFFFHYGLAWTLPSVRARYEIRSNILAAFRGEATNLRAAASLTNRNWKVNRGAAIMPSDRQLPASSVQILDAWPDKRPRPGQWLSHPINTVYLDKFLDIAAERAIPVFWLLPPHYRMFDRYYDQPNWSGLHREFIRQRLARYTNLVIVDGTHANYDRTVVMDVSHLNRNGAVAYSIALGDILRDHLSNQTKPASRWIELPAFCEPPTDAPVEDLAQSSQAIMSRR